MNDNTPFSMRCGGFLAAAVIRGWMSTLDCRAVFYDRSVDAYFGSIRPRIYVFWHEYILMPLYLRGHCDLAMLLSRHRDADILARVAHHMGFDCVRGSTNRGGAAALKELTRRGRTMHLAITPDGPRGPRRRLAPGPIYLASKLRLPIVPMGFGYDRPWRASSWDRFAIPKPFSRGRAIVGPEIVIPPELSRGETENCRQRVEQLVTDLTSEAEDWAEAGTRKTGEIAGYPQSRLLPSRMFDPSSSKLDLSGILPLADRTTSESFSARRAAG